MHRAVGRGCPLPGLTAAAGDPIVALIPPLRSAYSSVVRLTYRGGDSTHTITLLKSLWTTYLASAASSGATSIVLAADDGVGKPSGALAVDDWLCIELDDGSFDLRKITALSTLTCTVAALSGMTGTTISQPRVFCFGTPDDHICDAENVKPNPATGGQVVVAANEDLDLGEPAGLCGSLAQNQPLMVFSDNPGFVAGIMGVYGAHTQF